MKGISGIFLKGGDILCWIFGDEHYAVMAAVSKRLSATILCLMDQPMLTEVITLLLLIYGSIGGDAGSGWMFIVRFVVVMLSYHCIDCRE